MRNKNRQQAFTIVELIIVIVVIAILAALVLVAYNGVSDRAKTATSLNDLQTAATVLENDKTQAGTYPASLGAANNGTGLSASANNTFTYSPAADGTSYCLAVDNGSTTYKVTNTAPVAVVGTCVTPGTVSWSTLAGLPAGQWYDIATSADGQKIIAVEWNPGRVFTSVDGGANWTERTTGVGTQSWIATESSADGTQLAIASSTGYIYTSSNSGATWTQRTSAGSSGWKDISMSADGTHLAAVGATNSYPRTSSDSGVTWTSRHNDDFWGTIAMSDSGTQMILSQEGNLYPYRSSNSGVNWTVMNSNPQLQDCLRFSFSADGTIVYATSYYGRVMKSTDSGSTWQLVHSAATAFYDIVTSSNGQRVVTATSYSDNGYIQTSNNGGTDWVEHTDQGVKYWTSTVTSSDGSIIYVLNETDGIVHKGVYN